MCFLWFHKFIKNVLIHLDGILIAEFIDPQHFKMILVIGNDIAAGFLKALVACRQKLGYDAEIITGQVVVQFEIRAGALGKAQAFVGVG